MLPGVSLLPMKDALIVSLLALLPRRRVSRGMGCLARLRLPGFVNRLILRAYVRWYGVDTAEMVGSLTDYESLEAFFVRPLKEGLRPVDPAPEAIVSPVDGRVLLAERCPEGRLTLPGGQTCHVDRLLGEVGLPEDVEVAVLYLAPPDYHRIHHACEGEVRTVCYAPGRLWPVFPGAVRRVRALFERNERMVVQSTHANGVDFASVLVGAFGVGRISLSFWDRVSNQGPATPELFSLEPPVSVKRGQEMGRFHLGSTVVLVFPSGTMAWEISAGERLRMGQRIAHWTQN
jgi:phosphatidylserine decarboxylase